MLDKPEFGATVLNAYANCLQQKANNYLLTAHDTTALNPKGKYATLQRF